jgi:hypothetical protein
VNPIAHTRTQALLLTAQLRKQTGMAFGPAQRQAWASLKLQAQMQQHPTSFFYRKEDGSTRFAVGISPSPATSTAANPLVVRYYDTLADGLRSYRIDRLIVD